MSAIHIDSAERIAWVDLAGVARRAEIVDALDHLQTHPDYRPGMDTIYDCRRADFSQVTASDLRDLAEYLAPRVAGPARRAIVVDRDVEYGVARMWMVYAERAPQERRVFRRLEEARRWLLDSRKPPP